MHSNAFYTLYSRRTSFLSHLSFVASQWKDWLYRERNETRKSRLRMKGKTWLLSQLVTNISDDDVVEWLVLYIWSSNVKIFVLAAGCRWTTAWGLGRRYWRWTGRRGSCWCCCLELGSQTLTASTGTALIQRSLINILVKIISRQCVSKGYVSCFIDDSSPGKLLSGQTDRKEDTREREKDRNKHRVIIMQMSFLLTDSLSLEETDVDTSVWLGKNNTISTYSSSLDWKLIIRWFAFSLQLKENQVMSWPLLLDS